MKTIITLLIICICMSISCTAPQEPKNSKERTFDSKKDLLSLHYDHAPDKDDGHSAAADRTILQSIYGKDKEHNYVTN